MSGQLGMVAAFDPVDGLGWIDLIDGTRVRFGPSALRGFDTMPAVGTRVLVKETAPGFKGVLKAIEVVPVAPADPAP